MNEDDLLRALGALARERDGAYRPLSDELRDRIVEALSASLAQAQGAAGDERPAACASV